MCFASPLFETRIFPFPWTLWDCPTANLTFWFPMAYLDVVKLQGSPITWVVAPKSKYQLVYEYVGFSNKSNRFFKIKTCWTFIVNFSFPTSSLTSTHFLMSLNSKCFYSLNRSFEHVWNVFICFSFLHHFLVVIVLMVLIVGWLLVFCCCCCDPRQSLRHSLTQCPSWQKLLQRPRRCGGQWALWKVWRRFP